MKQTQEEKKTKKEVLLQKNENLKGGQKMRKKLILAMTITIPIVLIVVLSTASIVNSESAPEGSIILLKDDFEDGNFTNNPTWNVDWTHFQDPDGSNRDFSLPQLRTDHTCYFEGTINYPRTAFLYTSNPTTVGSWQFDSKLSSAEDQYNNLILTDIDNHWNSMRYEIAHQWNEGSPVVKFVRCDGDRAHRVRTTLMTSGPVSTDWHTLKISRDNFGKWELFVDDLRIGTVVDNTYTDFPYIFIGRYGGFDNILVTIPPIRVTIDIKPGSYPNTINLGSHGLVPVAILSSAEFDARTVDADTVELAGSGVAVRGKGSKLMAHQENVNGDELVDLVVQVETENIDPDSFQDGFAILTGSTYDGQAIQGEDEITIVPPEE